MERHSFSIVSGESPQDVLRNLKKLLLEILQNSQKKHLYWRLVVNEVAGWRPGTLFKRDSESRTFSCLFRKVFKKTFIARSADDCFWMLRSLLESLFVKFQVSTINRIYNCFSKKEQRHISSCDFVEKLTTKKTLELLQLILSRCLYN